MWKSECESTKKVLKCGYQMGTSADKITGTSITLTAATH